MVSFLVPAHNEEQFLGETLRAVRAAADPVGQPYELIVVDDWSTDATATIAAAAAARVERVTYRQISRTRNAGARVARGDRFVFVDADTLISGALVRATLQALDEGAAGGGATLRIDEDLPMYLRGVFALTRFVMHRRRWAAGCYVFCARAAFERVGGFDETLFASEEIAFSSALQRIGRVVILDEEVVTSARKARSHSGWDLVRLLAVFAIRGRSILRSRTHLEMWYGERRRDSKKGKR
jgi:glycosyltransferase involved in cell wall biosynthesis